MSNIQVLINKFSGRNIKIAVVDSGLDLKNPYINYNNIKLSWKHPNQKFEDELGHGTAITYLIQRVAKESIIYVVKVFDNELVTTTQDIIDSIKWCICNKIDIINLSISITSFLNYDKIYEICREALENNIIIVAAAENLGNPCLPAYLDNVIGVGIANLQNSYEFMYGENNDIQIYAKGEHETILKNKLRKVIGTSYATAKITSIIALIKQKYGEMNFESVLDTMKNMSLPYNKEIILVNNKKRPSVGFGGNLLNATQKEISKYKSTYFYSESIFEIAHVLKYRKLAKISIDGIINDNKKYDFNKFFKRYDYNEKIHDLGNNIIENKPICIGSVSEVRMGSIMKKLSKLSTDILTLRGTKLDNFNPSDLQSTDITAKDRFSIINLTKNPYKSLTLQIELLKAFGRDDIAIISDNKIGHLFGFDYIVDNNLIEASSEAYNIKLFEEMILNLEMNSDYKIILTGVTNSIFAESFHSNYKFKQLRNFSSLISVNPNLFIVIIDEHTSEEFVNKHIELLKLLFKVKDILLLFIDDKDYMEFILSNDDNYVSEQRAPSINTYGYPIVYGLGDGKSIRHYIQKYLTVTK